MRLRHADGRRLVLKDEAFIARALGEGFVEEPKKVNPYAIPYGALHECCLCDVTYRHGIDGLRCPHLKEDEMIRRAEDDGMCPQCGAEMDHVSMHERDSSNDRHVCPSCKWQYREMAAWRVEREKPHFHATEYESADCDICRPRLV